MRALIALTVLAALAFVGAGAYMTFQQRQGINEARRLKLAANEAAVRAGATANEIAANAGSAVFQDAEYVDTIPAHGLTRPTLQPFEQQFVTFCKDYEAADVRQRAVSRTSLNVEDMGRLQRFSRRCAVFALREAPGHDWLHLGWTALATLDLDRVDERGLVNAAGVLDHATRARGRDSAAEVRRVAQLASADVTAVLQQFIERAPGKRALANFGFAEVVVAGEKGLVRADDEAFAPKADLTAIGLTVCDQLRGARYAVSAFTIGIRVPSSWFAADDKADIKMRLARLTGAVSIDAEPQGLPAWQHTFYAYLAEASTGADASALVAAAKGHPDVTVVQNGRLFGLIVYRAADGGRPVETAESLARLAEGVGRVLR